VDSIEKIKMLRNAGISFSIDDFGKGYSSLNYLRHFPINTLKIDKSFVNNITTNQFDQVIVRAIIALAKELNFDIVVEGIEEKEQFEFLYNEGCRFFQGYLFSKPLKAPDFLQYYATNVGNEII
jgi:EAL domain-containing protein (putative c-di-GMP-specific phosphodiesterase class I)